jgi:hypothetical protein
MFIDVKKAPAGKPGRRKGGTLAEFLTIAIDEQAEDDNEYAGNGKAKAISDKVLGWVEIVDTQKNEAEGGEDGTEKYSVCFMNHGYLQIGILNEQKLSFEAEPVSRENFPREDSGESWKLILLVLVSAEVIQPGVEQPIG